MTQAFWKPKPCEPWRDWRTYSMLIPVLSGALGAMIFFALGLAFAEVVNIRPDVRTPLVLVASFTVAFGSTFGSIGSGIEVFRKLYKKQATGWDWVSLGISIATTIFGMVMGFASLLGATEEWSRVMTIYGCIVVGGFASLDTGGDMIELGGLFGSFEVRMEQWLDEQSQWNEAHGITEPPPVVDDSWPIATLDQWREIARGLNGERATIDADGVRMKLAERHLRPKKPSTTGRWARLARKGELN